MFYDKESNISLLGFITICKFIRIHIPKDYTPLVFKQYIQTFEMPSKCQHEDCNTRATFNFKEENKSPRRGMWNRLLQEITEKQRKERVTEQAMHVMREMRNAKLREHDWRISRESTSGWSDPKIWAEWCMYFNALRDLPQTQTPVIKNGKLSGVEWPVEPPTTDHHNRHVMIILFFVRPRIVQDSNACHQTSVTVKDLFEVYLEFLGHYKDVSPLTFDAYKELMCKTPSRSLCKTSFENMDGGPLVRGLHGRADVIMNFKLDLWGSEILKARRIRLMKHV